MMQKIKSFTPHISTISSYPMISYTIYCMGWKMMITCFDTIISHYLKKTLHRFTYHIHKKLFNSELDDSDEKNKVCNHTLRHTFASHTVMHNDIFLVQKLMNHKRIEMTLRYAKVDEDKKQAAVAKMF